MYALFNSTFYYLRMRKYMNVHLIHIYKLNEVVSLVKVSKRGRRFCYLKLFLFLTL